MKKTVFLFSGQGSQHFQMARALFEHEPVFRRWMLRLDGVVRDLADESVVEALYDDANDRSAAFDRLALTHPAIFMVEYALARALIDAGVEPDMTLGTSLGSFAAAAVAGFVDPEHALAAVVQQAAALETCCGP
ncbi:MAG TPA: acyltransferase domain-containing protein, partial [Xanthomonadales bacterium]|nr:acyltransferase domain-containing protein [Xanthomonadales bacterium]